MIKLVALPLFETPTAILSALERVGNRKRLAEQKQAIEALDQALNMQYKVIDRFEYCDYRYFILYRPATGGAYV